MNSEPIIRVSNICKSFGPTKALKGVSFSVFPGQIQGLIGENGSGKSTISSIISGNLQPDQGEIFLFEQPFAPKNSFEASQSGVSMIVQEMGTISTISVGANIFAGRENQFCKKGLLNRNQLNQNAQKLLNQIGAKHIHAETLAGDLSFEDRKLVEISRAVYKTPDLFIVDETTTALSQHGRKIVYRLIKELKEAGKGILFISHDIDELIEVCDSVTILRDGEYIATLDQSEMQPQKMKSLMVGREVLDNYYRSDKPGELECSSEEVLVVDHIQTDEIHDVSFALKKGEIIGFGGLTDCGMHQLGKIVFGLIKTHSGQVRLQNGTLITRPSLAVKYKLAYVSKNRDTEALHLAATINDNVVLPSLSSLSRFGFIPKSSEKRLAKKWCDQLAVKMRSELQTCNELSGGNKQKVALAKWLAHDSQILILDCPTRGIDVGVKESIYQMMMQLKQAGKSILMISEELPEILGMCDRIFILKNGKVTLEFGRDECKTESDIIQYMI